MNQTLAAAPAAPADPATSADEVTVLRYRQCRWCSSPTEHFRLLCPVCGSTDMDEQSSAGLGVVRRVGAVVRSEILEHRIRQTCAITLDEGLTISAVVTASRYEVVPIGTRVRLHAAGGEREAAEFRLA